MYNGEEPESDATNQWPIQPRPLKGGMDDMEEIPGVYVDLTANTCHAPASGEMERGFT
jgi:hypothetical protein